MSVAGRRFPHEPALRAQLAERLAGRAEPGDTSHVGRGAARAAVALTVVPGEAGRAELLLILRAANLRRHASQYGLPGGRVEPGERMIDAARRELEEELAVDVPPEGVLGRLPTVRSQSGFTIAPVVLWVDDHVDPVPDPVEVQEWYRLPLAQLATARVHHLGGGLPVLGTVIFAPTGAILCAFRDLLLEGGPEQRPEGPLAEPPFTRS